MPCEGGEAVMPANEAPLNNIGARVSTPDLKNLCLFGGPTETRKTASDIRTLNFHRVAPLVVFNAAWAREMFLPNLP
jgi:hypothetical protein